MKHPVQLVAILLASIVVGWIAIKFPQVCLPIAACCVLVGAMLACSCTFAGRKRNIDDPK